MKRYLKIITVFILTSFTSLSADLNRIKLEFENAYYSNYEEGQCGLNIDGFAKNLSKQGVDIGGVILVYVDGGGDLWAYSARSGYGDPVRRVWFHHYIMLIPAVDNMDVYNQPKDLLQYYVVDFDFLNQPTIVTFKDYLEQMFMPPSTRANKDRIARDINLGLMKFSLVDAPRSISIHNAKDVRDSKKLKKEFMIAEDVKFRDIY